MSDFEFDFESQLHEIKSTTPAKRPRPKPQQVRDVKSTASRPDGRLDKPSDAQPLVKSVQQDGVGSLGGSEPRQNVPEKKELDMAATPSVSGGSARQPVAPVTETSTDTSGVAGVVDAQRDNRVIRPDNPIDWNGFIELKSLFEYVGGARPIQLAKNIKTTQVSGLPDPLILALQKQLLERFDGVVVEFPFGSFKISKTNRVFTRKTSLMRYLIFDGYRDENALHLQYARQWLALQRPVVFTTDYDVRDNDQLSAGDELDIYALLCAVHASNSSAHTDEYSSVNQGGNSDEILLQNQELLYELTDRLANVQQGVGMTQRMVHAQNAALAPLTEQAVFLQSVLFADRMGLIEGSLPRDVQDVKRVLEENREMLRTLGLELTTHQDAERERTRRIDESRRRLERQSKNLK